MTTIDLSTFQIEKGNSFTGYEPPAPTPDSPIEIHNLNDFDVVSSVGKRNLLPNSDFSKSITGPSFTVNGKTYNQYPISCGGYNGGIPNPTTSYHAYLDSETFGFNTLVFNESNGGRDWKGVSPRINGGMSVNDTEYVLSVNLNTTKLGSRLFGGFYYYKKGGTTQGFHIGQFSMSPTVENQWQTISSKVPFPVDIDLTKTVSFYVYGYGFSSNSIIYVRNMKLEVGNSSTPYSPVLEDIQESDNHPLIDKINLLLDEPLRSVRNVKDRLFRDSDGLWKVERNVREYTFDGTEEFALESRRPEIDIVQMYSFQNSSTVSRSSNDRGLTSHFTMTTDADALSHSPDVSEGINLHNPHGAMRFRVNTIERFGKSVADTVNTDLNNWLINNPVTVVYELNTPTTETLDQELQDKLNNLRSFQDSNYVYTIVDKTDNLSDYVTDNLKPTLHARFLPADWYKEDKVINNLMIYNRVLSDEEMLQNYRSTKHRWDM